MYHVRRKRRNAIYIVREMKYCQIGKQSTFNRNKVFNEASNRSYSI